MSITLLSCSLFTEWAYELPKLHNQHMVCLEDLRWHTEQCIFGPSMHQLVCVQPCRACWRHATGSRTCLLTVAGSRHSSTMHPTAPTKGKLHWTQDTGSKSRVWSLGCVLEAGEEDNSTSLQEIDYAKPLHLTERKCSSRVCHLRNFPKL